MNNLIESALCKKISMYGSLPIYEQNGVLTEIGRDLKDLYGTPEFNIQLQDLLYDHSPHLSVLIMLIDIKIDFPDRIKILKENDNYYIRYETWNEKRYVIDVLDDILKELGYDVLKEWYQNPSDKAKLNKDIIEFASDMGFISFSGGEMVVNDKYYESILLEPRSRRFNKDEPIRNKINEILKSMEVHV